MVTGRDHLQLMFSTGVLKIILLSPFLELYVEYQILFYTFYFSGYNACKRNKQVNNKSFFIATIFW